MIFMMTPTSPDRLRQDARLIEQTLLRLGAARLAIRVAVVIIAIILWALACRALLSFGATVRYDALAAFSPEAVEFLRRLNPYLWWTVSALIGLAAFFAVKAWLAADVAARRARPVPTGVLADIAPGLSTDTLDVVRWIWRDRGEPLSFGDLRNAAREIRAGRVAKMYEARNQAAALDGLPGHDASAAPAVAARASDRQRGMEPRLGDLPPR